jgi:opacity protein-like surface antigen
MRKFNFGLFLFAALLAGNSAEAQWQSIRQEGEFGIAAGAAHYFGDINTRANINRPKPAISAFFRKQFGNYIALRVAGSFAQVGYSDVYSKNDYQKQRNLSFNSNIWELTLQGDFNFYRFLPGDPNHGWTPYVTMGAGVFNYDPYAYLAGEKYFLRPLGTEGQASKKFPDKKPYSSMAFCFPLGVGVKYNVNEKMNVGFEIVHRFTTTDYLDDVSTLYAGADAFDALPSGDPSPAQLLQDRSYEKGTPIGVAGTQRGWSKQRDQYIFAQIFVSFNLTSYRCPTAR